MAEPLIVSDPAVMMGKPVVAGTRITVELILDKLAAGETIEQLLEAHPRLTREGVSAALAFAAAVGWEDAAARRERDDSSAGRREVAVALAVLAATVALLILLFLVPDFARSLIEGAGPASSGLEQRRLAFLGREAAIASPCFM